MRLLLSCFAAIRVPQLTANSRITALTLNDPVHIVTGPGDTVPGGCQWCLATCGHACCIPVQVNTHHNVHVLHDMSFSCHSDSTPADLLHSQTCTLFAEKSTLLPLLERTLHGCQLFLKGAFPCKFSGTRVMTITEHMLGKNMKVRAC